MGGLHPIDILILALVIALSVLIIILRVRRRSKAKSDLRKCSGGCGSCGIDCGSNRYKQESDGK
ncbi:MAG: FeoB-associated Cys-rich membrane protein [Eubacteriales bacterium]